MSFVNLAEAAARFAASAADVKAAEEEAINLACQVVAAEAKSYIGHPNSWWPPLAESTIERKDNINTPLLESGQMRDSITWRADGTVGHVGSDDDRAVWQELGTGRGIPPRPFLSHAAEVKGPAIAKIVGEAVRSSVANRLATGHAFELIRLLRDVAHGAHDAYDSLVHSDDERTPK